MIRWTKIWKVISLLVTILVVISKISVPSVECLLDGGDFIILDAESDNSDDNVVDTSANTCHVRDLQDILTDDDIDTCSSDDKKEEIDVIPGYETAEIEEQISDIQPVVTSNNEEIPSFIEPENINKDK